MSAVDTAVIVYRIYDEEGRPVLALLDKNGASIVLLRAFIEETRDYFDAVCLRYVREDSIPAVQRLPRKVFRRTPDGWREVAAFDV